MNVGSTSDSPALEAAQRELQSTQPPRTPSAGPGAKELRRAYLGLLKLSLCDLVGTTTVSVGRTEEGVVGSRELVGDQLRLRAVGMDWPLQGLTMVGLARLDDLEACVETVVRDGVEGDLIEAGTWRGGASMMMRATLDCLGDDGRTVWVADSFQGFPRLDPDLASGDQWGEIDYLRVPLEEVRANFSRLGLDHGVEFVPGFFSDTLPSLSARRWALVRLDGDTYDATRLALEALYPGLSVGGYLIIDDYGALPECRLAVDEFRAAHGIEEELEEGDWTSVRWRRVRDGKPLQSAPSVHPVREHAPPSPVDPTPVRPRVPTLHELEVERELDLLRGRLAAAERELDRLRGSKALAAEAWLRRTIKERRR